MTDITTEDRPAGLAGVPLAIEPLKRRDFASDQEVRWCPGCGDYAILSTFQGVLPNLGIAKENAVVISGIGCSSRFPYYMNTYGMHSIHGRAPALATGVGGGRRGIDVKADGGVKPLTMLFEVGVKGLDLVHIAGVAVEQETVGSIVLIEAINNDRVG